MNKSNLCLLLALMIVGCSNVQPSEEQSQYIFPL
jgi:PBP1b-binding outer membrane lipoprotein LpoB